MKVLYVMSSSFSGSTLLAFLLNAHPDIFTVSEMDGWRYPQQGSFQCSCGAILRECKFFARVAQKFSETGVPFDFRNFGTEYRLTRDDRLNRYLTATLPRLRSSALERARDAMIWRFPPFRRRLAQQDRANRTFIATGLEFGRARVFVDCCKSPFRLRHLSRVPDLELLPVHVVRDVRGVALSNKVYRGRRVGLATRMWIGEQVDILRVTREFGPTLRVYYEDLCDDPTATLATIHRFAGLAPQPPPENFKSVEHHILGNWMRLRESGRVERDTRWQRELSAVELETISRTARSFTERHPDHPLSEIIRRYLSTHAVGGLSTRPG